MIGIPIFDPEIATAALIEARRSGAALAALPAAGRPANFSDAYAIQDAVARRIGDVAGWKVGAATPQADPVRAPLLAATVYQDISTLAASGFRVIGVEAEIVFRLGRDLPAGDHRWTRQDVLDAVASVHPAFEICDTRFAAFGSLDPLSHVADQANHGALIVGAACEAWRSVDFAHEPVTLDIDGARAAPRIGGNSAGDPVRLLEWLANVGARAYGGLRRGQYVTTGSCSGADFVHAGSVCRAEFANIGSIEVTIV